MKISPVEFTPIEIDPAREMEARQDAAKSICRHPERYQVCLGCESILTATATQCSVCGTYRFEKRREYVIAYARRNGARSRRTPTLSDLTA